jgi:hypothetical protein
MRRGLGLFMLSVCCVIGACSDEGPASSSASRSGEPNGASVSASLLEGTWDTGKYPDEQVRDAIVAAGYTDAETDEVVGDAKAWEFRMTFYEEDGVPFVAASGWDPTTSSAPSDADHGPYEVLPGSKLKITCDVCDIDTNYQLFSYRLDGDTLALDFIRFVNPEKSAYDRRWSTAYGVSWEAAPFHRQ